MGNFYTFALLELFLHCYTLGKKTLCALPLDNFTRANFFFTLALLVLLVTNFMSVVAKENSSSSIQIGKKEHVHLDIVINNVKHDM